MKKSKKSFPCKIQIDDLEFTSLQICNAFGFAHSEFMFRVAVMQIKEKHGNVSKSYL